MGSITWNTDVNAPCCPGEIVGPPLEQERDDRGRFRPVERQTILIQTDWEYPAVANSFGWSLRTVQRCKECGRVDTSPIWLTVGNETDEPSERWECAECGNRNRTCDHDSTDGTVDCACGVGAMEFISAAGEWLRDNHGATADDPGYFD